MTFVFNPDWRPIIEACNSDSLFELKLHLKEGFDIDEIDDQCRTGLMVAAQKNNSKCLPYLLKHKAQKNNQDDDGMTALMHAASKNIQSSVKQLIESKADPDITDNLGRTALSHAIIHDHIDMVKILFPITSRRINTIQNHNALMVAIRDNCMASTQFLLASLTESEIHDHQDYMGKTVFDWKNEKTISKNMISVIDNYLLNKHIHTSDSSIYLNF